MSAPAPPTVLGDPGRWTVALLMALTALGQIGVNLALPALPVIGESVGIASADTALILSTYLAGLAVGQLVVGPLSDRFGRKPVLRWGLVVFIAAGAATAIVSDAPTFLVARVVQGAGASASLALGRAIARDIFDGPPLVRVTALMTMAMAVVPGLAPILGGILTDLAGWRVALAFASGAGLILLVLAAASLPETNQEPLPRLTAKTVVRLYGQLISRAIFVRSALSNTLILAALYAFFAGAPRVLIGAGRLSPGQFGLVPLATAVTYILGGWALLRTAGTQKHHDVAVVVARLCAVGGSATVLVAGLAGQPTVVAITGGAALYALGLGALLPIGVASALIPFREEAGTASALLGAMQMAGGAIAGAAVGSIGGDPAVTFPAIMLACVLASLAVARGVGHRT